jgi:hypothetical protein
MFSVAVDAGAHEQDGAKRCGYAVHGLEDSRSFRRCKRRSELNTPAVVSRLHGEVVLSHAQTDSRGHSRKSWVCCCRGWPHGHLPVVVGICFRLLPIKRLTKDSPQQANLVSPREPPGTTQARHASNDRGGPETQGHSAHSRAWAEDPEAQPILPKQIQRRIPKAPATFGHDYKQQTATGRVRKLARAKQHRTSMCWRTPEALHGDAYHPESLRGWQVVTERINTAPRVKTVPMPRTNTDRSLGPRPLQRQAILSRNPCCQMPRHR